MAIYEVLLSHTMLQSKPMQQSSHVPIIIGALFVSMVSITGCGGASSPPVSSNTETQDTSPSFQAEEGPEGVRNYTRVDATVACAGATPPEAMAELRNRGFTTVINFLSLIHI